MKLQEVVIEEFEVTGMNSGKMDSADQPLIIHNSGDSARVTMNNRPSESEEGELFMDLRPSIS